MAEHKLQDSSLLSCELKLPYSGRWSAKCQSDGKEAFSGPVVITIAGEKFSGAVVRSAVDGGRVKSQIIGGAGGLQNELPAKNYANSPSVRSVAVDILRETGETLSPASDQDLLGKTLDKWQRSAGSGGRALKDLLEKHGAVWRMLQDGSVWCGIDAFKEVSPAHQLIAVDATAGSVTVATEKPVIKPGTSFRGRPVKLVVHSLSPNSFRTLVYDHGGVSEAIEHMLGGVRREIDFSRLYSARVVSQRSDDSLELEADSHKLKGFGMDRIPLRHGLPGSVKVSKGSRVMVGFADGDPSKPFAALYEGTSAIEVSLNGGTRNAAADGDIVLSGGPGTLVMFAAGTPPAPLTSSTPYTMTFITAPGPPTPYLTGVISAPTPKVKVP